MAGNIDEEPLNTPLDTQSENPSDEIIPSKDSETINQNQETEKMEVHHHLHHEAKKNWKSYLWEFLMLFLAVFCGFLAEYQLEHIIEHKREKQFIRSFIEDLKIDTTSISRVLVRRKQNMERLDSLMELLKNKKIRGHENDLYFFGRTLTRNFGIQANDRTITQLKNSGSLRLIRSEQAADSIMLYQKMIDFVEGTQNRERDERLGTYPILSRMFNPFVFDAMLDKDSNTFRRPVTNPPLRSYDENIQLDLAFAVHQLKSSSVLWATLAQALYARASNIISFLKAEYDIE